MASTYSDRLKLELMATGANANTWGTNTNNNLEVLDAFAAGYLSKSVAGSSNITLTTANASDTAESSNKVIELTVGTGVIVSVSTVALTFAEGTETATGGAIVDVTGVSMATALGDPFSTPWANVVTGASNTWTEVNAA